MPRTHQEMFEDFVNGRLSKDEWTHEAHLVTCWVALRDRSPEEAIDFLRVAITTHNCGIGIANTETSGYHETLTQFYVRAVDRAGADSPEALFDDPSCDREAPLRHWTRDRLFSPASRAAWIEPDRAPVPWSKQGTAHAAEGAT